MIHVLEPSQTAHTDLCQALTLALVDGADRGKIDYLRIPDLIEMANARDCNVVRFMLEEILRKTR